MNETIYNWPGGVYDFRGKGRALHIQSAIEPESKLSEYTAFPVGFTSRPKDSQTSTSRIKQAELKVGTRNKPDLEA